MDEATPHLHIDYIPVGHYKRGQDTQNGIAQLRRDVSSLQAEVDDLTEFVSLLKRFEPQKYAEVRQAQEYIHSQCEQEVQQQSATRKKEIVGTGISIKQDRKQGKYLL